jgi:hypothetical protein
LNYNNLIFKAYENEIALEKAMKTIFGFDKSLINFKVQKLDSIKTNFGLFFPFFYFFYFIYVLFFQLFNLFVFILFLLISLFRSNLIANDILFLPTDLKAEPIIKNVYEQLLRENDFNHSNRINIFFLLKNLKSLELVEVLFLWVSFYFYLLFFKSNRILLYFNSIDSLFLILLVKYMSNNEKKLIITDDQCQRWAFLISNISKKAIFVQHGFFPNDIKFPHKFGKVDTFFVRDFCFKDIISLSFDVNKFEILNRNISFIDLGFPLSIFIASSSPFIDNEIFFLKILRKLKNDLDFSIIVKKHPAHVYNTEKLNLLYSLSDHVYSSNENLMCNIFVSHSSFMQYDYSSNSIHTFSLVDYSDYNELVKSISIILKNNN